MRLLFALLLAVASPAWAGEGAPERPEPGAALVRHGEITAVDRAARTVTVETTKGPETFTLAEGAIVVERGRETDLDALAVGQKVAVKVMPDEADRQRVRAVEILDPSELEGH